MKRSVAVLFSLLFAGAAFAAGPAAVRKRVEASMLVTGTIQVAADGSVASYALDKPDKLPPVVTDLIQKATPTWHFKLDPVNGAASPVAAKMTIRMLAKPVGDDNYSVSIASANFGEYHASSDQIGYKDRQPPRYPSEAVQSRVAGTVYLVMRVGRDGKVADIDVEQVNLEVIDSDNGMKHWRKVLGEASIKAARDWTYNIPTTGKFANSPYYVTRVPVNFDLNVAGQPKPDTYGKWVGYVPGPRESIPWMQAAQHENQAEKFNDALPEDGTYLVGSGLKLITPLGDS
jgi:hypothetical protein